MDLLKKIHTPQTIPYHYLIKFSLKHEKHKNFTSYSILYNGNGRGRGTITTHSPIIVRVTVMAVTSGFLLGTPGLVHLRTVRVFVLPPRPRPLGGGAVRTVVS